MKNETAQQVRQIQVNQRFVEWLDGAPGRAQYFSRVDPTLVAPLVSKLKKGRMPFSFETALRLERAQRPSDNPFKAEDLLTYAEDLQLLRYVRGLDPAPAPVPSPIKPTGANPPKHLPKRTKKPAAADTASA